MPSKKTRSETTNKQRTVRVEDVLWKVAGDRAERESNTLSDVVVRALKRYATEEVFAVSVTREDQWWMISVPAIDGLTQAKKQREVRDMARDLIAITLDVPVRDVRVEINYPEEGEAA
jgi:L-lactate utilization protein LutC